jgi:superfamily II DNA/RNA helicase
MGHGVKADSIHGNKRQSQRQRALDAFKQGRTQVLVATDVAARGIDVSDVSHVINYDLPATYEDYVHRIGRTGRAGKRGKALTFVE